MTPADAVFGAMLGCAVGDALGLPYEGLSKRRGARLLGAPTRHRFLFGRGMVSDDTEHTWMAAQALCAAPADPAAFARAFAGRLRWWLLGCPAGVGSATLLATVKLWLGFAPTHSGVFSAGNGPAMRSAVLGAAVDDFALLRRFVEASTRVTHTDPKALDGALAVAAAAWCARRGLADAASFLKHYRTLAGPELRPEFDGLLSQVERGLAAVLSVEAFAAELDCGRGVTGYVYRTVPVALFAWLRHPGDFAAAVGAVIRCGGDTDTTAAIVGGIIGSAGPGAVPADWAAGLWEWPRTTAWSRRLAAKVAEAQAPGRPTRPPGVAPGVGLVRNLVFLAVVLVHAARRLLPPY